MHNRLWYLTGPFEITSWTRMPGLPIAMHNRLKYRGEWCYTDSGCNQNGMLSTEYMAGWGPIWSIDINLIVWFARGEKGKEKWQSEFIFEKQKAN